MGVLHNRPLATGACFAVLLSLLLQGSGALCKWITVICALVLLLFLLLFLRKRKKPISNAELSAVLALLLSALLLGSSAIFFDLRYAAIEEGIGEESELEGTVLERVQSTAYSAQLEVRITRQNGKNCSYLAILDTAYATSLQRGDRFCLTATSAPLRIPRAFGRRPSCSQTAFSPPFPARHPRTVRSLRGRTAPLACSFASGRVRGRTACSTPWGRHGEVLPPPCSLETAMRCRHGIRSSSDGQASHTFWP